MAINQQYFQNLILRINSLPTCSQEVSVLMGEAMSYVNPLLQNLEQQIANDASLIIPPTDLITVIEWINKIINQYVIPYEKKIVEYTTLASQMEQVIATFEAKVQACINYKTILKQIENIGINNLIDSGTGLLNSTGQDIIKSLGINPLNTVQDVVYLKNFIQIYSTAYVPSLVSGAQSLT